LEALDSIWRGLHNAAPTMAATHSLHLTATPGALATSGQTPIVTAAPGAGLTPTSVSGKIVFGLSERRGESYTYPGVYLLDLETLQTRQLFGEGVRFQSSSPDGKYLLVSEGSALYRTNTDGTQPLRLTDSLYAFGNTDAVWLSTGQIGVVLTKAGRTEISVLSADGGIVSELMAASTPPVDLYSGSNSSHIYWESGSCSAVGVCQRGGAWVTSMDGKLNKALTGLTGPVLAPDGNLLASGKASSTALNEVVFSGEDGTSPHPSALPGNLLIDYAWSPLGDQLAVIVAIVSDYSGKTSGFCNYLVDPRTQAVSEYAASSQLNPHVLWSPDGLDLFWIGTTLANSGYQISASLVNRSSKQVTDLGTAISLTSPDYLAITNAEWLPLP
jgi:hypothetical protein